MDPLSPSQEQKEIIINEWGRALEVAQLFGLRTSTTNLLTLGYYGGNISIDGAVTPIAAGTIALTASATNYVEATLSGTVSKNTTAFTAGSIPLYQITTNTTNMTAIVDKRVLGQFMPYGRYATPFMGAKVKLTADLTAQNYSGGTSVIGWDAEDYDTHGFHNTVTNNSRLTVPSGYGITKVRIVGQVRFGAFGTTNVCFLTILKDGAGANAGLHYTGDFNNADPAIQVVSPVIDVVDGTYFEINVYSNDTSVTVYSATSFFAIEVVECTKTTAHKEQMATIASVSGALGIPLAGAGRFKTTLTENVTSVVMSGVTAGLLNQFELKVTQGASAYTWANPSSWKFSGTAYSPSAGAGAVDIIKGRTYDDGTTWQIDYVKGYA